MYPIVLCPTHTLVYRHQNWVHDSHKIRFGLMFYQPASYCAFAVYKKDDFLYTANNKWICLDDFKLIIHMSVQWVENVCKEVQMYQLPT